MKLKLLKPYSMFPKDEIVEFDKPIAELLILRKIAEPWEEKKRIVIKKGGLKDATQPTVE